MNATQSLYIVTGGAGFIGSHLCESLLSSRYKVICIDNLITGKKENISDLLNNPNFTFIEQDVTDPSLIKNLIRKLADENLQYIFHLASPASPPQYKRFAIETLMTNSLGTKNILDLASQTGAKFLLASTSEVYGDPKVHPQTESYWGNVNSIGERACYDEAKRFAESLTMEYFRKKSVNAVIVRIFNTYGPKMDKDDGRVISNFCYAAIHGKPLQIYGDGSQTRSFCFISDMVEGLILALSKGESGQVYNLGNPIEKTINEIAGLVVKLSGSKSKITHSSRQSDDPARRKPVIKKAQKILTWQPTVDLKEGLIRTIEYFRKLY